MTDKLQSQVLHPHQHPLCTNLPPGPLWPRALRMTTTGLARVKASATLFPTSIMSVPPCSTAILHKALLVSCCHKWLS